jgi:hypothetical protein
MNEQYVVSTPLGEEQRASTPEEVRTIIDRYMQSSHDATLNLVSVMRMLPPTGQAQVGQPLSPGDFWQPTG